MKRLFNNQAGVTIIELLAAFLILSILLVTILGALLFGQKAIVGNDQKNNEAAIGQDYIDEIVTKISNGADPDSIDRAGTAAKGIAYSMDDSTLPGITPGTFNGDKWQTYPRQFYIVPYPGSVNGYNIYYRSYYNEGKDQINFTAFVKQ
ncbi:prepilin-type N-terminal cleavage/methylation domain-containing protein [Acetobacterium sp.]|uniref:type IV pilus modification PilV family protein n=1 Tax=Acetobacterium sp. TaxID=1872094 RepID=UPI0035948FA6